MKYGDVVGWRPDPQYRRSDKARFMLIRVDDGASHGTGEDVAVVMRLDGGDTWTPGSIGPRHARLFRVIEEAE